MVKKCVLWAMVAVVMIVIFKFSSEPAQVSDITSGSFCYRVLSLSESFRNMPEADKQAIVESMQHIVRKTAHFTIYALLGALLYIALKTMGAVFFLTAPLLAAFYAVLDEVHQLFVAGRSGEISDVLLDFTGALFGALIARLIIGLIASVERRRANG